jgi:hypothetical protein
MPASALAETVVPVARPARQEVRSWFGGCFRDRAIIAALGPEATEKRRSIENGGLRVLCPGETPKTGRNRYAIRQLA